ncbi:outer membrane protein [Methylopila turkensis]|uniref:Outer membrane protein n=1 Tax=Methylopila turkensis TaxID=1437816 RepID=A0A9W6N5R2_9HYPH|nr:outer membrane protein [Methylopila turkensis]GLK78715.1 outer membrane protein [Methylopila turkensis]
MIRRILLGAASAAAFAAMVPAAMAADLPAYEEPAVAIAPVPSFTWTGPYIGVQAGYGWGSAARTDKDGFTVGGYAGYNYQFDNSPVVIGIETDFNYSDADGSRRRARTASDWNGATRARVGYAFDRFLVYGAAGVAYADRELRVRGLGRDTKTAVGWTVGGGLEYAAAENVSVRAEYRYNDYGKDRFSIGNGIRSEYTEHRVMGGVAYKFNSPF